LLPELPSVTEPDGVRLLPVPTVLSSKAWLKLAVSPLAMLPEVIVGVSSELVLPS
jgi:hypothetical protein